jgi:DNA-binding NarL/FixJ family response regulator
MIREGLASSFAKTGRWKVIGQADSPESAESLFAAFREEQKLPDIVLLDIDLGKFWGLDLVKTTLKTGESNDPKVLVYSVFDDYAHIKAAIRQGVDGYVCKSQPVTDLVNAMETVLTGVFSISPALAAKIADISDKLLNLTRRERQIAEMVQRRLSNSRIARELGISVRTVENHLYIIYDKTGVKDRRELEHL